MPTFQFTVEIATSDTSFKLYNASRFKAQSFTVMSPSIICIVTKCYIIIIIIIIVNKIFCYVTKQGELKIACSCNLYFCLLNYFLILVATNMLMLSMFALRLVILYIKHFFHIFVCQLIDSLHYSLNLRRAYRESSFV